jgi:hypothetical protein
MWSHGDMSFRHRAAPAVTLFAALALVGCGKSRTPGTDGEGALRGNIVAVSDGEFRYDYYDVSEPDSSYDDLHARGYQGGGPSWHGIVYGLVKIRQPDLLARLRFDPEGDGLAVWSSDRDVLVAVARLVTAAKRDPALLTAAIDKAVADGQME